MNPKTLLASGRLGSGIRNAIVGVLALTVAGGCGAPAVQLSKRNREAVQTVAIDPNVRVAETVSYRGPAFDGYEPFPTTFYSVPILRQLTALWAVTPVGLYQIKRSYDRMAEALTARIDRAGIDVGNIVYQRFRKELRRSRLFPAVVGGEADATVTLAVDTGLCNTWSGLGTGIKPWMHVEAEMIDGQGRVLWRKRARVSTFEKRTPMHEGQEFFDFPELFEDALYIACKIAVEDLVDHLGRRGN